MTGIGPLLPVPGFNLSVGPPWSLFAGSTATIQAADRAHLMAFEVSRTVTVSNAVIAVTTQAGNVDVGIYDAAFARLASTGSTAVGAAGEQVIALTAAVTLYPGRRYWAALSCDSAAAFFAICGIRAEVLTALMTNLNLLARDDSAFPLPATATPETGAPKAQVAFAVFFT